MGIKDFHMTKLWCIRHGHTIWNLEERYNGLTDIPLDPFGVEQAEVLSERWPRMVSFTGPFTAVTCSVPGRRPASSMNARIYPPLWMKGSGRSNWENGKVKPSGKLTSNSRKKLLNGPPMLPMSVPLEENLPWRLPKGWLLPPMTLSDHFRRGM